MAGSNRPRRVRSADSIRRSEWLYGRNAVCETLRAGKRSCRELLVAEGHRATPSKRDLRDGAGKVPDEAIALAHQRGVPIYQVPRTRLDEVSRGANHQGVCLRAGLYPYASLDEVLEIEGAESMVMALDSIQDPQNLGTLLRSAEAFGVAGVLIPEHRAAEVTPAVVNASSGAVEHLRLAQVVNLARSLEALKERGYWIVGLEASDSSMPLGEARLDGRVTLVVGSEGSGMRRLIREHCDVLVKLPMLGKVESLNAATAGSIALYQALLQRGR